MKRGTIVLTAFPFTDLKGQRVRPAVVVSGSHKPGNDVILGEMGSLSPNLIKEMNKKLRLALEL